MAKQDIQIGRSANDGTGDTLRVAFGKVNANFEELYAGGSADLGSFKISGNTLGTTAENDGWGASDMILCPNGEGYAYIYIPNDTSANAGASIAIGNSSSDGGGVQLVANNGSWQFNNGGSVLFPTIQTNLHNGGTQNAQTLQFSDPTQQVVITGPTPTGNDSAQRLIIQGQRGAGTGEGGDVYFWGGDADIGGGDIKIYAGDADSNTEGYGGYVNIDGGNGFTEGGNVSIAGGNSSGGQGADVYIRSGYGIDAAHNGSVNLQTGNNTWQFKPDGTISAPNNTLNLGIGADLKGSEYAELFYEGVDEDWQGDATRNTVSWVWTAYDGTFIEHVRANHNSDPTWQHQWAFKNDGSFKLPTNGTIVDADNNILVSSSTFADLPNWLTAISGTAHLPTINTDYGWDSNGVWFTNATIGNYEVEGTSYPVRLVDPISASHGVVVTVEFDANPFGNDFGIGVWETGDAPEWSWVGATGGNRIGAQYDGTTPVLKGRTGTGVDQEGRYDLPAVGSYKARLTISAPDTDDEITVTLETLDLSDNVLDTISYVDSKFTSSYLIGFASDQDNGNDKTYMKNLTVNINGGATIHTDELTSYNSVGTTGTGHFAFADNTVTVTGQDMNFVTTRTGFDVDCDFDVNAADDVWIDAAGDAVSISAANNVNITTSTLNMYPDVYDGQENNFIGTWDGFALTLDVPNSETTLISLLTYYVNDTAPVWIHTASGYAETYNGDPASKTVGQYTTVFVLPLNTTSPTANADVINIKLYDSINNGTDHLFEFTKNGALLFPSGGKIESVGMGWMGVTNGTEGTPVSILAKNSAGDWRSSVTVNNFGTAGGVEIATVSDPGTPTSVANWNGQGGWNQALYTNLATTGGTGTGLTVDVAANSGGYINISAITITNPGSGYTDGDVITIDNENSLPGTFTIGVSETTNSWYFTDTGKTTLPGAIAGRVKANTYTDTTIELDVNATINKITPVTLYAQHYHLADGVEGQIMYITLATGGDTSNEYTILGFDHARYHNNAGYITESSDVGGWMPFRGSASTLTLLFIDGHWNLPHAQFD